MNISKAEKPRAYQLKNTTFCDVSLYVDERAYVPNPETELLVSEAKQFLQSHDLKGYVIDVGTGSGNIAIALAKGFPQSSILSTDISIEALEVARINIQENSIQNVNLLHTDLVSKVHKSPDLIVCNLPWGASEYMLDSNSDEILSYMPTVAVYPQGGVVGSYSRLIEQVKRKGWKTTILAEVGKIPKDLIQQEIDCDVNWEYVPLARNYAILRIQFN